MILRFFDGLFLITDSTGICLVNKTFIFAAVDVFGALVAQPFKLILFLFQVYGIFAGFVFFVNGIDLGLFGIDLFIN